MKRECWTAVRGASGRDFNKISPKPAPLCCIIYSFLQVSWTNLTLINLTSNYRCHILRKIVLKETSNDFKALLDSRHRGAL